MTGLEKITTQIIDDAKASAQKAKAAAEEEASKILASAKAQREEQAAQIAAQTQAQFLPPAEPAYCPLNLSLYSGGDQTSAETISQSPPQK